MGGHFAQVFFFSSPVLYNISFFVIRFFILSLLTTQPCLCVSCWGHGRVTRRRLSSFTSSSVFLCALVFLMVFSVRVRWPIATQSERGKMNTITYIQLASCVFLCSLLAVGNSDASRSCVERCIFSLLEEEYTMYPATGKLSHYKLDPTDPRATQRVY